MPTHAAPLEPLPHPRRRVVACRAWVVFPVMLALAAAAGCADLTVSGSPQVLGPEPFDAGFGADSFFPLDTGAETAGPDAGPQAGFIPRNAVLPSSSMKDAPGFIVPATVVAKRSLALSNRFAAWVEVSAKGTPTLVTWDLFGNGAPQPRPLAAGSMPAQLVVSDDWLAFVDTQNDPDGDLFAMNLETSTVTTIAATPRFQRRPTLFENLLAWEDCRNCVPGAGRPPSAIYFTSLGVVSTPSVVTAGGLVNQYPRFGTLADGAPALTWIQGALGIRVQSVGDSGAAVDATFTAQDYDSEGVTLNGGTLVYRAQPAIINPDSMIPTDPWALDVLTGAGATLATAQNIRLDAPSEVVAAGTNFAWLRQVSADPTDMEVVVVSPVGSVESVLSAPGATEIVGGGGWIGFVAPRADNGGVTDVWFLPAP